MYWNMVAYLNRKYMLRSLHRLLSSPIANRHCRRPLSSSLLSFLSFCDHYDYYYYYDDDDDDDVDDDDDADDDDDDDDDDKYIGEA